MLTIKKTEDLNIANQYLKAHNIEHNLESEQVMCASDDEDIIGLGSLALMNSKVYLNFLHAKDDDAMLLFGLAKSLLNMADLRGIQTIYGNNPALFPLYKRLRFKEENGEYVLSLAHYFEAEHHYNTRFKPKTKCL